MSWDHFLNMEPISLEIASSHINLMTDADVFAESHICKTREGFIDNIKNGFVAITMLCAFAESITNTILGNCIGFTDELLKVGSIMEKLEIAYIYYRKDISRLKGNNFYADLTRIIGIRNQLIHYKNPYLGSAGLPPDLPLRGKKDYASKVFKKDSMSKIMSNIISLFDFIANDLGLSISKDVEIFTSDATGESIRYIYDSRRGRNHG